jgi:hypothetical protein
MFKKVLVFVIGTIFVLGVNSCSHYLRSSDSNPNNKSWNSKKSKKHQAKASPRSGKKNNANQSLVRPQPHKKGNSNQGKAKKTKVRPKRN